MYRQKRFCSFAGCMLCATIFAANRDFMNRVLLKIQKGPGRTVTYILNRHFITIFLIVGFGILLYYALLPFIGSEPLKKFDKCLKLASIDMHMLMLFGTMTVMGPIKGFAGEVPVGFPIVFIYICLICGLLVEAYAYFITEKK